MFLQVRFATRRNATNLSADNTGAVCTPGATPGGDFSRHSCNLIGFSRKYAFRLFQIYVHIGKI